MTVDELLRRVSSSELVLWREFFQEEPWGYDMENWRSAMLACTFAEPYAKKGSKPKIKNFLPKRRASIGDDDDSGIYGDPL